MIVNNVKLYDWKDLRYTHRPLIRYIVQYYTVHIMSIDIIPTIFTK